MDLMTRKLHLKTNMKNYDSKEWFASPNNVDQIKWSVSNMLYDTSARTGECTRSFFLWIFGLWILMWRTFVTSASANPLNKTPKNNYVKTCIIQTHKCARRDWVDLFMRRRKKMVQFRYAHLWGRRRLLFYILFFFIFTLAAEVKKEMNIKFECETCGREKQSGNSRELSWISQEPLFRCITPFFVLCYSTQNWSRINQNVHCCLKLIAQTLNNIHRFFFFYIPKLFVETELFCW